MNPSTLIHTVLNAMPVLIQMAYWIVLLSFVVMLTVMFKPMLVGLWRASRLFVKQFAAR